MTDWQVETAPFKWVEGAIESVAPQADRGGALYVSNVCMCIDWKSDVATRGGSFGLASFIKHNPLHVHIGVGTPALLVTCMFTNGLVPSARYSVVVGRERKQIKCQAHQLQPQLSDPEATAVLQQFRLFKARSGAITTTTTTTTGTNAATAVGADAADAGDWVTASVTRRDSQGFYTLLESSAVVITSEASTNPNEPQARRSSSTKAAAAAAASTAVAVVRHAWQLHVSWREGQEVDIFRFDVNAWLPGYVERMNAADGTYVVELFGPSEVRCDAHQQQQQ